VKYSAFVDGYSSINVLDIEALENGYPRAFDSHNGFALSWVGVDLSYEPGGVFGPVGATISLRAGPTATALAGADAALNLAPLSQAYVTLQAFEGLSVDFGKFNTLYGAEVAESWLNHNYTRGALYTLLQPAFHTGLRVNWAATDTLFVKFLAVNGYTTKDNNAMKTFGLQVGYAGGPWSVSLGYLLGPEQDNNNKDLKHLIDLIVGFNPSERLSLTLNADFVMEEVGDTTQKSFGVLASGRLQFTDIWGVGLRGEFIGDADGYVSGIADQNLVTGTLTIMASLGKYALLSLDTRLDYMTEGAFIHTDGGDSKMQLTSTLGVVFKTE